MVWRRIRGIQGEERADLRNGMLCSLLVNMATRIWAGKKGTSKATDHMPYYEKPAEEPMSTKQMKEQVEVIRSMLGAPAE